MREGCRQAQQMKIWTYGPKYSKDKMSIVGLSTPAYDMTRPEPIALRLFIACMDCSFMGEAAEQAIAK